MIRHIYAALAVLLLLPAAAQASSTQESMFEDEFALLQNGPARQAAALDEIAGLGADSIRSIVYWYQLAPAWQATTRPAGFDAANPAAYPAGAWDRYDDLVRGTQARGMSLLFSPSAPIPAWASGCKGDVNKRHTCRPNAKQFGLFVRALGTRYSGTYRDENQGGGVLPRVDRWSIWNEPNQPGWLNPQQSRVRGRTVFTAARMYRSLVRAAVGSLRATGHGSDLIMLGETSPIGRASGSLARRPITPGDFVRTLLCLRMSGKTARLHGCRGFKRLGVNAFAHHPYTRGGSQPPNFRTLPGEITIRNAGRLKRLLDAGGRAGRVPRRLPIWYTEYGFQTKVRGDFFGVSDEAQARYINQSDWMAFRDGRIKSVAQYKLVDDQFKQNFQTGLRRFNGSPKPSYDAYRLPIWVSRRGATRVRVFGQVRPAAPGAVETVEIQRGTGGAFAPVHTVQVSSARGHFLVTLPRGKGAWRLHWTPAGGGAPIFSRVATVAKR